MRVYLAKYEIYDGRYKYGELCILTCKSYVFVDFDKA